MLYILNECFDILIKLVSTEHNLINFDLLRKRNFKWLTLLHNVTPMHQKYML